MSTTTPEAPSPLPTPAGAINRWLTLVVVCFAQFMVVLDATVTNVALPSIQNDLGFSPADLQWVVNSYTLAFGGFLLFGGRAADLFGRRLLFLIGTVIFTAASLLNGMAESEAALVAFRALQGLGAAFISPAALSIIMTSFDEGADRGKALGVWSAIAAGGGAIGLLLGGILTEWISWEWIFFINVPIGLLVALAAIRWVPESRDHHARGLDWAGAVTATAGLMLLVYAIVGVVEHGWLSAHTIGFGVASIVLLLSFLVIESRITAPLVRLQLLVVRSLAVANSAMLLVAGGMFAFFYFATLHLQQVLGYTPIECGLAFLPFTAGIVVGAGSSQALVQKIGVKAVSMIGLALSAGSLVYLATSISVDSTYLSFLWGIIPMSIGMGSTFVPLTLVATTNVDDDEAGLASGVFNTSQQIGGAIGLAVLSTIAANTTEQKLEELGPNGDPGAIAQTLVDGFSYAYWAGSGMMFAGLVVVAIFLRRKDVANVDASAPAVAH